MVSSLRRKQNFQMLVFKTYRQVAYLHFWAIQSSNCHSLPINLMTNKVWCSYSPLSTNWDGMLHKVEFKNKNKNCPTRYGIGMTTDPPSLVQWGGATSRSCSSGPDTLKYLYADIATTVSHSSRRQRRNWEMIDDYLHKVSSLMLNTKLLFELMDHKIL